MVASWGFSSDMTAIALAELKDQFEHSTGLVWEKADYMDLAPCSRRADQGLS
jgi:hypothetical protein